MKSWINRKAQYYIRQNHKRKRALQVLMVMCLAVLMVTAYVLILPAVAMEQESESGISAVTEEGNATELFEEFTTGDFEGPVSTETETEVAETEEHGNDLSTEPAESNGEEDLPDVSDSESFTDAFSDDPSTEQSGMDGEEPGETESGISPDSESGTTEVPDSGQAAYGLDDTLPTGQTVMGIVNTEESDGVFPIASGDHILDLSDSEYITAFRIWYQDENGVWIRITSDTQNVPADANVRVELEYESIPIDFLIGAGGVFTYRGPDLLKDPQASGAIVSGNEAVGTVVTDPVNNLATMTLDLDWLQAQKDKGHSVVGGSFYMTAQFDHTKIEENVPGQIVVGGTTVTINFESDAAAKHGDIETVKSVAGTIEETADGAYLTYTLTVSVPDTGVAIPEVRIVDTFTGNGAFIDSYVGVTGAAQSTGSIAGVSESYPEGAAQGQVYIGGTPTDDTPIPDPAGDQYTKPGTLVWVIGEMQPGQTRTLTYQVKLKDDYVGAANIQTLTNTAQTYSKIYKRDEDTAGYTPKATASVKKTGADYIPSEDGKTGRIKYTVVVQGGTSNAYTLTNVKLYDYYPSGALVDYGSYVTDSFKLYEGNGTAGKEIDLSDVNLYPEKDNPQITNIGVGTSSNFTMYIGDLAPGQYKTVTYEVEIDAELAALRGNTNDINNRTGVHSDDSKEGGDVHLNTANSNKTITIKKWDRKMAGNRLSTETAVDIPASDTVYSEPGSTANSPGSFTVHAGSYRYNVIVNETGDWDLSSAALRDSLSSAYLRYSGYLKVSAYKTDPDGFPTGADDQQALTKLEGMTPEKTVWLDINGDSEFSFQPSQLGLDGQYAYLLTYYASPHNTGGIMQTTAGNSFTVSGDVTGPSGNSLTLPGVTVSTNVTIQGGTKYSAEKSGWYSTVPSEETSENYKNGAIYWAVKLNGDILEGFQVGDYAYYNNGALANIQRIYEDAVAGVYLGPSDALRGIGNLGALEADDRFTRLTGNTLHGGEVPENADYTWNQLDQNGTPHPNRLKVVFQKDFSLGDSESIYIIVKTAIDVVADKPEYYAARNGLATAVKNETLSSDAQTIANMGIAQNGGVIKKAQGVYTYDGTEITPPKGGNAHDLIKSGEQIGSTGIRDPGIYLSWLVRINTDGMMNDSAVLSDMLPEGTELSYVRFYSLAQTYNDVIEMDAEIPELDADPDWQKGDITAGLSDSAGTRLCVYYYNKTTGEVRWAVDGIKSLAGNNLAYIEFQVVARVTHPGTILGQTNVFDNVVTVTDKKGRTHTDSSEITVTHETLRKESVYTEANAGTYPFQITINPLGEDMVAGSDTITLIDELSSMLELDTPSVKVVNSRTGEDVSFTLRVEKLDTGQRLIIILPDDIPLTITYRVFVDAAPGQVVSFSNIAHWEGFAPPDSAVVEVPSFQYSTGGTVNTSSTPIFTLLKVDENDTGKRLAGAEFSLQAGTMENGVFTAQGEAHKKTTDENGSFVVSTENGDSWFAFNTVYCLKEVTAPQGYVLPDGTPYYFLIAEGTKNEDGEMVYPDYPEGVFVWYNGAEYEYTAYNGKGEIRLVKAFQDKEGAAITPPDGTYRFGLWDNAEGTDAPLQTLTITYSGGVSDPADPRFTNLDLQKTYYVFELDENGNPISEGQTASVDGKLFQVAYSGNSAEVGDGTTPPAVTVTNRTVEEFELPETGGKGIYGYISGGLLLMALAVLIYHRKSTGKGGKKEKMA